MNKNQKEIIAKIADEVKVKLLGESSGHDWWHILRVWNNAKLIAKSENANMFIVEAAALLHDIADYKLNDGDEEIGPRVAGEMLLKYNVDQSIVESVRNIIRNMNFHGNLDQKQNLTIEGKIVKDADRLDAIGAVGIGRTFAYGGNKGFEMYNPNIKVKVKMTKEEYVKNKPPTINHFYEKLLKLEKMMETKTAKKIAKGRHKFMELYLKQFFAEWNGKK
jgi:uncharacterized protein